MSLSKKDLILYKKNLVLSDIQKEILVGTLLGDATIPAQKGNAAHNVKWEQKASKKGYIDDIYFVFKDWVGTPPVIRNIKGGGAQDRQSIWFRTYRHSAFTYYRHLFYKVGKGSDVTLRKRVPENIIELLTPRALAYWFMDDGTADFKSKIYGISTHSFNYKEHELLLEVLDGKFKIKSAIHKDGEFFRLYIKRESVNKFTVLINPYIVDCMKYKLILE